MLKKLLGLILFALPLNVAAQNAGEVRIFDKNFAASFKDYDGEIKFKRTPLEFDSGKTVETCTEYLQEKAVSKIDEGVMNTLYSSEYMICDALAVLDNSGLTAASGKRQKTAINYGREIYNRLDLKSFPSSKEGIEGSQPYFFKNFTGKERAKFFAYQVISNAPDWYYAVAVLAAGDFDGDGKNDLLLQLIDTALKDGNYKNYATLVIYDFKLKGVLRAKEI